MQRWMRLSFSKTLKEKFRETEMFANKKTAYEHLNKNTHSKSEKISAVRGRQQGSKEGSNA